MEFGLNEIFHLHDLTSHLYQDLEKNQRENNYPFLVFNEFGDKQIHSGAVQKKFLASYAISWAKLPIKMERNDPSAIAYIEAISDFTKDKRQLQDTLRKKIIHNALEIELPFLKEVQLPKQQIVGHVIDFLQNAGEVLEWLQTQEVKFGMTHDIRLADAILPETDPDVALLKETRKNYESYMIKRGLPFEFVCK